MQELITEKVSEGVFLLPYSRPMLTHEEIREELIRQVGSGKIKQADVARALGVAPARVAEMRKRTRLVQQDEMPKLARLLGLSGGGVAARPILSVTQIPNWGKVAQGVWIEESVESREDRPTVPYDRMHGDPGAEDLFAVTPEGNSMNKVFMPGSQLICRRVEFNPGSVRAGQYVIATRTAHDLRELTCKRVEVDTDGVYWLHSESTDPKFAEPWRVGKPDADHHEDTEISIVGRVLRAVQDFENQ